MTATVLHFPRPARRRKSTTISLNLCEVISLSAWRHKLQGRRTSSNVLASPIRLMPQTVEKTTV